MHVGKWEGRSNDSMSLNFSLNSLGETVFVCVSMITIHYHLGLCIDANRHVLLPLLRFSTSNFLKKRGKVQFEVYTSSIHFFSE